MTTPSKTGEKVARSGEVEALLHRLRRAPRASLLELVEGHGRDFTIRELRQVLLNPFADGEVLQVLAANRKLVSMHEARAAIARHRRTPEPIAMRLIPNLFWRELAELTLDLRIRASVRRVAERYLTQRLPRLSEGEKINLARRSVETVAARLIAEARPRVVDAGLDNPRLSENALLEVVTAEQAQPRLLARIAGHPRWGVRYEVRAALCRQAKTPYRFIIRHLDGLRPEELVRVAANEEHADFLRAMARELLARRALPGGIGLESSVRDDPETFTIPGDEHELESAATREPAGRDGDPQDGTEPLAVDV